MNNQRNICGRISTGIPPEPVGSIPRPRELQHALVSYAQGAITSEALEPLFDKAVSETISRFEVIGSPVVGDGEQTKSSFATYSIV